MEKIVIDDRLKKIQEHLLELIEYVDSVLTMNNVWYSLSYGSVLGAVRHEGFIPWDDDVDIIIRLEDVDKVTKLLKRNLKNNMHYQSYREDSLLTHDVIVHKDKVSHVDIYPLIGAPSNYKERQMFLQKCHLSTRILRTKFASADKVRSKKRRLVFNLTKSVIKLIPDEKIRNIYFKLENKYSIDESDYYCTLASDGYIGESIPKEVYNKLIRLRFEHLELPVPFKYQEYLTSIYGSDYMEPKVRSSLYIKKEKK